MTNKEYNKLNEKYIKKLKNTYIMDLVEQEDKRCLEIPVGVVYAHINGCHSADKTNEGLKLLEFLDDFYSNKISYGSERMCRIVKETGFKKYLGFEWKLEVLDRRLSIEDIEYTLNSWLPALKDKKKGVEQKEQFNIQDFDEVIIKNLGDSSIKITMKGHKVIGSNIETVVIKIVGNERTVSIKEKDEPKKIDLTKIAI